MEAADRAGMGTISTAEVHNFLAVVSVFIGVPMFVITVWHLLMMYLNPKISMLPLVVLLGPASPLVPYFWNEVGLRHRRRFLQWLIVTAPFLYGSWMLLSTR